MKRLVIILALLSIPAWATGPTYIATSNCGTTNSGSNCTLTTTSGTGHLLVVGLWYQTSGGPVQTVTDSAGDSFVSASCTFTWSTGSGEIWYFPSTTGNITTVTATLTGGATYSMMVWEASGTAATAPLDKCTPLSAQTAANPTGGAVVISQTQEVVFGFLVETAGTLTSIFSGNPFTYDAGPSNFWGGAHYQSSSAGTFTPQWTNGFSRLYGEVTVSFGVSAPTGKCAACDISELRWPE